MNKTLQPNDISELPFKLFCDRCKINTNHYTKPFESNGKTFCKICDNMTEYTFPLDGWLD